MIARPLIDLTRKAVPFHWDPPQMKAFETLKTLMCRRPILRQPDYTLPFFLATDASAYGVGAILLQEGETNPRTNKPIQHPIAYYLATFSPAERNYDIYERELLAVIKALEHWRPHVAATEIPVTILTDHANLTFWKNPKKVNRRVARWFATLQEYNLLIKHVPGKFHAVADMLSRPPDANQGHEDNQDLTLLLSKMFIRLADFPGRKWFTLEDWIQYQQSVHLRRIAPWVAQYKLNKVFTKDDPNDLGTWLHNGKVVIPPSEDLR